jgi:FkbM family methyltransferase
VNSQQIVRLKERFELARQDRLTRLRQLPLKTVLPYLMRSSGWNRQAEAKTFFDRTMQVVIPEPVSVTIWRYGFFEEDVCFYLMSLLRPGDTFIDIGGHFGFFSMLGRELVGRNGIVVTFEPMPSTRNILGENMSRHAGPAHHHLIPAAAGDKAGRLTFKDFGLTGSAFATSATQRSTGLKLIGEVDVDVRTLDSVVDELGLTSCRLVKIDAENAEYDVIQGGLASIRRLRPSLILEAGDDADTETSTRRVIDVLLAENYVSFEFRDWALSPHAVSAQYGYQNLLMIPRERVADVVGAK